MPPSSTPQMARPVVLSVEDDDTESYIIKIAVEECGVPVDLHRAADGEQALRFLHRTHGHEAAARPDLILLDMTLPKKDGLEVLSEIRRTESLRSIPVVIFTSSLRETERKKAIAFGADDCITKPRTLKGLTDAIRSLCDRFFAGGGQTSSPD
jgi:CheY-like chemotaxis protein